MRVNPIRSYNGLNSAPRNKQVSFGLIENEENTKRVLPKKSDYRIPFDTQWKHLQEHPAVTVTSEGDKAWARINPGFESTYGLLDIDDFTKTSYLVDLQEQDQFDSFYHALEFCDAKKIGAQSSSDSTSRYGEKTAFDEATEGGFGVKVW